MAFSRYYQITNQLVAEYTCDQYNIVRGNESSLHPDEWQSSDEKLYMYAGLDGLQYCVEETNWNDTKFPSSNGGTYLYIGDGDFPTNANGGLSDAGYSDDNVYAARMSQSYKTQANNQDSWQCMDIIKSNFSDDAIDADEPGLRDWSYGDIDDKCGDFYHDRVRVYLLQGYVMNSIAGLSVKVKAHVASVQNLSTPTYKKPNSHMYKKVDDYLTMLDWYMPKEKLRDKTKWLTSPLYMNSKFYDRYIDIYFPSPYACAINWQMVDYVYEDDSDFVWRGQIDKDSPIIVQIATVQPDYTNSVTISGAEYAQTFQTDSAREFAVRLDTNSNWFGVRLQENIDNGYIEYYPTYGSGLDARQMDYDMFMQIDSGSIPLDNYDQYDSRDTAMDDFIEAYSYTDDEGKDQVACRWVIINELSITYNYRSVFGYGDVEAYTEYITNTIDYTGKENVSGEFWKSRLVPAIVSKTNRECETILLTYTCHLYNRVNNADIVKTATMVVENPEQKYLRSARIINTGNITQYKVVNKIEKVQAGTVQQTSGAQEKLVRSYYDATDIIVKDVESGLMYTQGKMTLHLKHSSSNYMIRVYTMSSDNVRIPYDLTGIEQYKLVFPSVSGGKIQVYPNMDSESNKLGIGSLVFYIPEDKVKEIMNVPESDRYFALVAEAGADTASDSTVYEGSVDYYS